MRLSLQQTHSLKQICQCSVCENDMSVNEDDGRDVEIYETTKSMSGVERLLFLVSEGRCPLCTSHVSIGQTPDRILKKYNAYVKTSMQRKKYA